MRILYCIPTLACGGAERQLAYLAAEMLRRGHEVHVAFARGGENHERLRGTGVTMHDLGGSGKHDLRIVVKLVRLVRALKPDVVQTALARMDVAGGIAALCTRTPWVLREGSSSPNYADNTLNRLRRLLAGHAHAIVSNSRYGDDYWRSVDPRKRHILPNGVPFSDFNRAQRDFDRAVRDGSPRQTIVVAGRLDEGKNVGTVIEALDRVARRSEFDAVVAGDGPLREDLQTLAAAHGLADRVSFVGTVPSIPELLSRADVVVSLSRWEGCPNVVLEAMAAGAPLVLSDIPAHRELLDDRGARFVPPDDAGAAAEAIDATLRSAVEARERGNVARAAAAQRSIQSMAARYAEVYESVRSTRDMTRAALRGREGTGQVGKPDDSSVAESA